MRLPAIDSDNTPLRMVDETAVAEDNKRLVIKRGFITTVTAEDKKQTKTEQKVTTQLQH